MKKKPTKKIKLPKPTPEQLHILAEHDEILGLIRGLQCKLHSFSNVNSFSVFAYSDGKYGGEEEVGPVMVSALKQRRHMRAVLEKALLGCRVLKTMLSAAGLKLGEATAVEHIAEIETVLGLKPGEQP